MRRSLFIGLAAAAMVALVGAATVSADHGNHDGNDNGNRGNMKASLSGFQEVPAISTQGTGTLQLSLNSGGTAISFVLTYAGLEGGAATASHIHIGQPGVNGAVVAFLCGGGSKPACPAAPATVSGTIVAADILDASAQGIAAGQLSEVVAAIRAGVAYVNVHDATFPSGEIRGAIGRGKHD